MTPIEYCTECGGEIMMVDQNPRIVLIQDWVHIKTSMLGKIKIKKRVDHKPVPPC